MKLPGYIEVYLELFNKKDPEAMKLQETILKYGVKEVKEVDNDTVKGEYLTFNTRGLSVPPVYFVGIHLKTGKKVVEVVA